MADMTYTCKTCGPDVKHERDDLFIKRIQFGHIGKSARIIKTRTIGWFCRDHMEADPDYKRDAYSDAPGTDAKRTPEDDK